MVSLSRFESFLCVCLPTLNNQTVLWIIRRRKKQYNIKWLLQYIFSTKEGVESLWLMSDEPFFPPYPYWQRSQFMEDIITINYNKKVYIQGLSSQSGQHLSLVFVWGSDYRCLQDAWPILLTVHLFNWLTNQDLTSSDWQVVNLRSRVCRPILWTRSADYPVNHSTDYPIGPPLWTTPE